MAEDYWQTALEKIKADRIRANKIALQKRLTRRRHETRAGSVRDQVPDAAPMIPASLRQALEFARETLHTCAPENRDAAMNYINSLLDRVWL